MVIEKPEELFAKSSSLFIINGDWDVKRFLSNTNAEEDDFNGWQKELEEKDREVSPQPDHVLLEKGRRLLKGVNDTRDLPEVLEGVIVQRIVSSDRR
jgi:hypothetical protein